MFFKLFITFLIFPLSALIYKYFPQYSNFYTLIVFIVFAYLYAPVPKDKK